MRSVRIIACCLALLAAGCDTIESRYVREGIGSDLYWDGLPAATQLQDIYLSNMCAQAISPTARSALSSACDGLSLANRDWGLLVQAGMNDIDLRCDAYLSWLHDKRSSREPVLKELAALGGATAAILRASEVSATPIALAGIAFGLAADTFTNADLRLMNGVDYTTVQSVVRGNRTEYRKNNLSLVIDNRPAAIYVLRNYLAICTPASIEMSINNTINVYHRGGPEALLDTPIGLRVPVATASTAAAIRGRASSMVVAPPVAIPPVQTAMQGATGAIEIAISRSDGRLIQRSLCATETGVFDDETRSQLRLFNAATLGVAENAASGALATDADLRRLRASQRKYPSCRNAGFLNAYELGLFTRYDASDIRNYLKLALAAAQLPASLVTDVPPVQPMDATARQAVRDLRTKYGLPGQPILDKTFFDTMLNTIAR